MRPRVHHFSKQTEDVKILTSIKFSGVDGGFSSIIREFIQGIKSGNPPRPRYHINKQFPNILKGEPDNFLSDEEEFGTIRTLQVAQDEEGQFYLCFETNDDDYYYTLIP